MTTLIGLIALLIIGCVIAGLGIEYLITNRDNILVGILSIIIGIATIIISICGIAVYEEAPKKETQIEIQHSSLTEEYNYCHYCGKDMK